jgi:hypothetical protein
MKSLYAAMLDPALFGHTFGGPKFAACRTVAKIRDFQATFACQRTTSCDGLAPR